MGRKRFWGFHAPLFAFGIAVGLATRSVLAMLATFFTWTLLALFVYPCLHNLYYKKEPTAPPWFRRGPHQ